MIWILGIVLGLLVVSQIHLYSIIKRGSKEPKIVKGSIILKPLPDKVDSDLVEGAEEMLSEVLESVKLEEWKVDIKESSLFRGEAYDIIIKSPNDVVVIDSVVRYKSRYTSTDFGIRLLRFKISTNDISDVKSYSFSDSKYGNDIIVFLWDFILEKHLEDNRIEIENYKSTINEIRKKLTGLRRSERLNQLLDE
jgi:hypothetical protein